MPSMSERVPVRLSTCMVTWSLRSVDVEPDAPSMCWICGPTGTARLQVADRDTRRGGLEYPLGFGGRVHGHHAAEGEVAQFEAAALHGPRLDGRTKWAAGRPSSPRWRACRRAAGGRPRPDRRTRPAGTGRPRGRRGPRWARGCIASRWGRRQGRRRSRHGEGHPHIPQDGAIARSGPGVCLGDGLSSGRRQPPPGLHAGNRSVFILLESS